MPLTYRQRQEWKWARAMRRKDGLQLVHDVSMERRRLAFRVVEAAIESIAPGRQNRTTAGWEKLKARAHSRAIAAYGEK